MKDTLGEAFKWDSLAFLYLSFEELVNSFPYSREMLAKTRQRCTRWGGMGAFWTRIRPARDV